MSLESQLTDLTAAIVALTSAITSNAGAAAQDPVKPVAEKPKAEKPKAEKPVAEKPTAPLATTAAASDAPPADTPATPAPTAASDGDEPAPLSYDEDVAKPFLKLFADKGREAAVTVLRNLKPDAKTMRDLDPSQWPAAIAAINIALAS